MKDNTVTIAIGLAFFVGLFNTAKADCYLISDFDDGIPDWAVTGGTILDRTFVESGGQLVLSGRFPATLGNMANSFGAVGWGLNYPIEDGHTIEYRVDLLRTSPGDVLAGIEVVCNPDRGNYGLTVNEEGVYLDKIDWRSGLVWARLFHERLSIPTGNVVISFALTRVGDNLQITGRILDKSDADAVLFEKNVIDTSGIDPTVDQAPGVTNLEADPGPPYFRTTAAYLHIDQISDGNQPRAEVAYDNFTYAYGRLVKLAIKTGIGNAVELAWPALVPPLPVETALGVDGPWVELTEPAVPRDGTNYLTLPISPGETSRFFRLNEVSNP